MGSAASFGYFLLAATTGTPIDAMPPDEWYCVDRCRVSVLVAIGNLLVITPRYEWHDVRNQCAAFDWMADLHPNLFQAIARLSSMPVNENLPHDSTSTLAPLLRARKNFLYNIGRRVELCCGVHRI